MLLACDEYQTAAASTAQTGGLSAFTCKLLEAANQLPADASTRDVVAAAATGLAQSGFRQTCSAWAPANSGLLDRSFLHLHASPAQALAPGDAAAGGYGLVDGMQRLAATVYDAFTSLLGTNKGQLTADDFSRWMAHAATKNFDILKPKDSVLDMTSSSTTPFIDPALERFC